jgi:hypothetical protein
VIGFNEVRGMNLVSGFPCVVHFWVSLPFDEILEHSGPAKVSMVDNALHLIFFFSF